VYRFVDTAGIRKRGKVQYGSEFFMVNRALKAIRRSDVVVLVLDAVAGVSDQDRVLAERIAADGRACVVVLNKWDAVASKDDQTYLRSVAYVQDALTAVKWAPVLLVSALTGQRCPKLYGAIDAAVAAHRTRVSTATLNDVVRDALAWQPPPAMAGRGHGKIYYANQVSHSPPTFALFCNRPALFSDNYKRYLERKLRESLAFEGTPLRFVWRGKRVREIGQENKKGRSNDKGSAQASARGKPRRSSKED
jgi:GTP-binding protein